MDALKEPEFKSNSSELQGPGEPPFLSQILWFQTKPPDTFPGILMWSQAEPLS